MKALTLRGAWWWWALTHQQKDVENRNWVSPVRGRVAIHIAKTAKREEFADFLLVLEDIKKTGRYLPYRSIPSFEEFSTLNGHIVGTVQITDCVTSSKSPWFFGKYGYIWKLEYQLPVPIPFKGALGFWEVPPVTAALIEDGIFEEMFPEVYQQTLNELELWEEEGLYGADNWY